jgi:hypothetical protein
MRNKLLLQCIGVSLALILIGCGGEAETIEPTPLVLHVRFDIPSASPKDVEKYFVAPLTKALKSAQFITTTHGVAMTNGATVTVFFEEGIKFAEGNEIINAAIVGLKSPKPFEIVNFTELCGDDLSQSDIMHIAKGKGVKPESILERVITVTEQIGESVLPKAEFDAMFSGECDEPTPPAPLYVLDQ